MKNTRHKIEESITSQEPTLDEVCRAWSEEVDALTERCERLEKVAEAAKDVIYPHRLHGSGCNCSECALWDALAALEQGKGGFRAG